MARTTGGGTPRGHRSALADRTAAERIGFTACAHRSGISTASHIWRNRPELLPAHRQRRV
jgi:hypothetical protein